MLKKAPAMIRCQFAFSRALLALGVLGIMAGTCLAGMPSWLSSKPSYHARSSVHRYVIVSPKGDPNALPGEYPWTFTKRQAAPYPWGYFGAKPRAQHSTHVRYYGDARDVFSPLGSR